MSFRPFYVATIILALAFGGLAVESASAQPSGTWVSSFKTIPLSGVANVDYGMGGGAGLVKVSGFINLNVQALVGQAYPGAAVVNNSILEVKGSGQGAIGAVGVYNGKQYKNLDTDWFHVCVYGDQIDGVSITGLSCQAPSNVGVTSVNGTHVDGPLEFKLKGFASNGQPIWAELDVCVHMIFASNGKLLNAWASFEDCGER